MLPRRAPRTLAVVAATLLLTGCLGTDGDDGADGRAPPPDEGTSRSDGQGGTDAGDPSPPAAGPIEAPEWLVGDAWTFDATYEAAPAVTLTVVVVALEGDTAIVGVTDTDAAMTPLFTHWPPIGRVRPQDLGVTIHGTAFGLVRFPLEEGATWTTDVRGEQVIFAATMLASADAAAPPKFSIVGRAGDAPRFSFVYDPAVRWFERFDYVFPSSEDVTHHFALTSSRRGYAGPAVRLDWTDAYVGHRIAGEPPAPPADTFNLAAGPTSMLAGVFHGGGPGVVGATVASPAGERFTVGGARTATEPLRLEHARLPPAAGSWVVEYSAESQTAFLFAEVLAVVETPVTVTPQR